MRKIYFDFFIIYPLTSYVLFQCATVHVSASPLFAWNLYRIPGTWTELLPRVQISYGYLSALFDWTLYRTHRNRSHFHRYDETHAPLIELPVWTICRNTDIHAAFRRCEYADDDSVFHERRTFCDTEKDNINIEIILIKINKINTLCIICIGNVDY